MKIQWFLIFVAYSSLAIHAFLDISRAPLFPEFLRSLDIGTSEASYFFSTTSFCMVVSTFGSGRFLRIAPVGVVLISYMLLLVVGQYLLYIAGSLPQLILSGAFLGLGFGGMGVCQNIAISESAPEKYHRKLFGGLHSMYALAALLAPLTVGNYLAMGGDWRQFTLYVLWVPIAAIVLYMVGIKKLLIKKEQVEVPSVANLPLKWKLLSSLSLSFYVSAELIVSIWLVIFLQREKNFSVSLAGNSLSLFFLLLLCGRISLSIFSIKISDYKLLLSSFFASSICLFLGLFVNPWFLPISGLFMSVVFPSYMSYISENFKENLKQIMPYCIGGMSLFVMIAHSFAGYLGEIFGLSASLFLAFVACVFAGISLWYLQAKIVLSRESSELF